MNSSSISFSPASTSTLSLRSKQTFGTSLPRSKCRGIQIQATADLQVSRGKRPPKNDVVMVDPLEAKRLAALQMQEIQARNKLKRQKQIEAINGAWAMIGLTAGLVIEGQTGNSFIAQVIGYFEAIVSFFTR